MTGSDLILLAGKLAANPGVGRRSNSREKDWPSAAAPLCFRYGKPDPEKLEMVTITNHVPTTADAPQADILGIEDRFPELLRLTEELFGASARVITETDAELPTIHYAVVETTSSSDLKQLAERHREWHRRVRSLLGPDSRKVRLSVDVQQ